ncbi:MAG TPA: mycofactocin biosynthesis peptidyl-dipeptidase MftE [Jiangellaceae bacterium]
MTTLAAATWPDIQDRPLVLVPLGSIEQHGPHLPLDTDAVIAEAVTTRVAKLLRDEPVFVAPVLAYGASGEHQTFAGTSSIGTDALRLLLVELVRSMSTWAGRIVLVNGHGGNLAAVTDAVARLRDEGHDVAWAPCTGDDVDAHAGYTETSLMLYLRPSAVRLDRAEPGETAPLEELWPTLIRDGVGAVSANGVLGDPSGASADEGARCLEAMAAGIAALIRAGRADARGMLQRAEALAS